jgi:hypothetical protein
LRNARRRGEQSTRGFHRSITPDDLRRDASYLRSRIWRVHAHGCMHVLDDLLGESGVICRSLPFSQNTTSPKVRWTSMPITRRIRTSCQTHDGGCGRHDSYGFALSAQPGESQRRPATNSSSRLIVCIGLPALRAPGASVPMVAPYATM